ncbi:MAG: dihydropteroate synthase [Sporomusaceae bacterium]|nr:dihydropteroate synthase [Sporomusaceae bacterium]
MNFNPRLLNIGSEAQARAELARLGCDPVGINIMSAKAVFKIVRLEKVPAKAANLLKQTFLAKGGEVALTRGTADLSVAESDVLICATLKQYRLALAQLKLQPWGLPKVAAAVEAALAAEAFPARRYEWPGRELAIGPGRTVIMGILNVTPDSFSDGGRFNRLDDALRHAEAMLADGADVIDIGAESTRPYGGAVQVSAAEEMERLLPVVERVLAVSPLPVSVDTYKAAVAAEALRLGAHMVNDVWGLQRDPDMAAVCARYGAPVVVMHNQEGTAYDGDVMAAVCAFLRRSVAVATEAGVAADKVIVDPGIGFGKTPAHNLAVLNRLDELKVLGCPVLLGTSRKRFIGEALGGLPPGDRVAGTAATVACGIMRGAHIVRVHDVKEMAKVARMTDVIMKEAMDNG